MCKTVGDSTRLILAVISVVFTSSMMGTRPMITLLANDLGATPVHIGVVVALFSFIPLFLAVQFGRWIDDVGCKAPILISTLLGSFALFVPFFWTTMAGIYVSQVVGGITNTIFLVAAQSVAGKSSNQSHRESNVVIFSIGISIGSFLGPLMAGVLSDWIGYPKTFAIMAVIGLLSTLVTILMKDHHGIPSQRHDQKKKKGTFKELLHNPGLRKAFLISGLILLAKDIYTAYFPLLAFTNGISGSATGIMMAINAGAGIFIRLLMSKLIMYFGKEHVIVGSICCSGVFLGLLPFVSDDLLLALLSFFLGVGLGIGQPLSITFTLDSLAKDRVGQGLGLRLTFNRLTQVIGPVIFGGIAEAISITGVFLIAGALVVLGSTKVVHHDVGDSSVTANK